LVTKNGKRKFSNQLKFFKSNDKYSRHFVQGDDYTYHFFDGTLQELGINSNQGKSVLNLCYTSIWTQKMQF